eukprot:TRINITY_DN712_c0_g1_i4.p1 TRINITY_DN712_c0_g1~~TRINITY_DN712_c0_g1_i4.p1  ORF type:complete len:564 (+),score=81.63 TRINITY_DN712_c0_g1_i4:62-1693(+)
MCIRDRYMGEEGITSSIIFNIELLKKSTMFCRPHIEDSISVDEFEFVRSQIPKDESIAAVGRVMKFNEACKRQERFLVVTESFIYNITNRSFYAGLLSAIGIRPYVRRKIALDKISDIIISKYSGEWILHVPDEYDYRFTSDERDSFLLVLLAEIKMRSPEQRVGFYFKNALTLEKYATTLTNKANGTCRRPKDPPQILDEIALKKSLEELRKRRKEIKDQSTVIFNAGHESVTLDDFIFVKVLGRGAHGKVFLAESRATGKLYAIKGIAKNQIRENDHVEYVKTERFILERADHPFLVKLEYAFQNQTALFFVMQYVAGGDLFGHFAKERRFTESRARMYAAEILLALEYLHSMDFVYRDLKPENVLMGLDGHLKLTDYGLSKFLGKTDTCCTLVGTADYVAPEVIKECDYDKTADWWSFGIFVFEMIYGRSPFYHPNRSTMLELIQKASIKFPSAEKCPCSNEAKDLILKLLAKNSQQRLGRNGAEEIKRHPWFASLDWGKILRKEVKPSYVPSRVDLENVERIAQKNALGGYQIGRHSFV